MKKSTSLILASIAMAFSFQVNAAGVIDKSETTPAATAVANADCAFVSQNSTFKFTASKNVGLTYACNKTNAAIQAGNTKGKYAYGGNTSGGSVTQCGTTLVTKDKGYNAALADVVDTSTTFPDGCGGTVSTGS